MASKPTPEEIICRLACVAETLAALHAQVLDMRMSCPIPLSPETTSYARTVERLIAKLGYDLTTEAIKARDALPVKPQHEPEVQATKGKGK